VEACHHDAADGGRNGGGGRRGCGRGGRDAAGPKKQRRTLTLEIGPWQALAAALLLIVGFAGGWMGYGFIYRDSLAHNANERLILQAWDDIDKNYVETSAIDHRKMAYAAIARWWGR